MMKLVVSIVMLIFGSVLVFALDEFIAGNIWLVGAMLLAWMPKDK